jgi:dipeptidyl aminopeptidase/acylaminoacyl peptidase
VGRSPSAESLSESIQLRTSPGGEPARRIRHALCVAAMSALGAVGLAAEAAELISVDDLVRRTHIPTAAISPDGTGIAYIEARGDPVADVYEVVVRVIDLAKRGTSQLIGRYQLSPEAQFNGSGEYVHSAGNVVWISGRKLLWTRFEADGSYSLLVWQSETHQSSVLSRGHGRLSIEPLRTDANGVDVVVTETKTVTNIREGPIEDRATRVEDNFRFHGSLTPKPDRTTLKRVRTLTLGDDLRPHWGDLAITVKDRRAGWLERPTTTSGSATVLQGEFSRGPSGADARVEWLLMPGKGSASRLAMVGPIGEESVTPYEVRRRPFSILGWSADGTLAYYAGVYGTRSVIGAVSLQGHETTVHVDANAQLTRPCPYDKLCQTVSADGRLAVLARSTNNTPDQLSILDLRRGRIEVIVSPNIKFEHPPQPHVEYRSIGSDEGSLDGRLYLPTSYQQGKRYPLVITQYISRPGFDAATGDEVPIHALSASGIAVFAMNSQGVTGTGAVGDFRFELDRVRRPTEGMEWIVRQLTTEGIVDPDRVGLTGLSYGSEIAMYAYWRSGIFCAVSSATGSWDPSLMQFGGLAYASYMERRGFPIAESDPNWDRWRELAAGLNATANLPPLLLQSPDTEQLISVPTWFRARRQGAPVEFFIYPGEGHVKQSPANKWWVYSRNLDWFRFWLQGYEDPASSKSEQYARWRQMRESRRGLGGRCQPTH